jgi:hypothetical protein
MEPTFRPDSSLAFTKKNYNDWEERIELSESGVMSHRDEEDTGRGTRDGETSSGAGIGLTGDAEGKSGKSCKS